MNMMQNNSYIKLRNKEAFDLLKIWSGRYLKDIKADATISFLPSHPIGTGTMKYNINDNTCRISIGIAPISMSFFTQNEIMQDSDFVKIGVTMYHELTHFNRNISENTPHEILHSNLSTHQNKQYYIQSWNKLPHEIDAEFTGIMSMWSQLEGYCSDVADRLMMDYLTTKATTTKYVIDIPEEGFQTKQQVDELFEKAYDTALNEQRKLPYEFLRFDDDISKLLTTDEKILRTEYVPFYQQLAKARTGQELDLKMASLVSYVHPELQKLFPGIDFAGLEPTLVFDTSISETADKIKYRIGVSYELDDDFTKAVENIPMNENNHEIERK